MAAPAELSIEEIRSFIVSRGGKVTNHDLVKHFKKFLTDPERKGEARETFKTYVNLLGTIKNENGEKYIVLKKKKTSMPSQEVTSKVDESLTFSPSTSFQEFSEQREPPPYIPPPTILHPVHDLPPQPSFQPQEVLSQQDVIYKHSEQISKHSPPFSVVEPTYRMKDITPTDNSFQNKESFHNAPMCNPAPFYRQESIPKPIDSDIHSQNYRHPNNIRSASYDDCDIPKSIRRESLQDNLRNEQQFRKESLHSVSSIDSIGSENMQMQIVNKQRKSLEQTPISVDQEISKLSSDSSLQQVSTGVIKRQKKNLENIPPQEQDDVGITGRSESCRSLNSDCEPVSVKERLERFNKFAVDGDQTRRLSVKKGSEDDDHVSMNQASHDWIVKASSANYQALSKLLNDDPKLVRVRDPITNALHWAAKHGEEEIIKMCAGKCLSLVNQKSNGGYTPLHIAFQFRNDGICKLLTEVYGADREIRDNAGRKPRQYQVTEDTSISPDTYKRIMGKKKQADQKFLRIGSLNLRVKKTTHAFSNFLGVGTGHKMKNTQSVKLGKLTSWGSADDIQEDRDKMPPPQSTKIKRKVAKKNQDSFSSKSRSTPSTPNQPRSLIGSGDKDENISPSPSSSTLHDSDSDTACGFDSNWQDKK